MGIFHFFNQFQPIRNMFFLKDGNGVRVIHDSTKYSELCLNMPKESFYIMSGGKIRSGDVIISDYSTVEIHYRLRGGKGGFGAALRGKGAKASKKKTTDFSSCRDLDGRRVRDVQNEVRKVELQNKATVEQEQKELEKQRVRDEHKVKMENDRQAIISKQDVLLKNQSKAITDAVQKCLKKRTSGLSKIQK
jgi:hypothetical protein